MKLIAALLIWLATCMDPSADLRVMFVPYVEGGSECSHDWKTQDYHMLTYIASGICNITDIPEHEVCIRCGSERYNKWDGTKIIYGEVLKR